MKTPMLLLAALLLLTGNTFAQLQTGTKYIGLHAGGSLTKEDADSKTTTFQVGPSFSYFLTQRLMVGISWGYSRSVYEQHRQQTTPGYGSFYSYDTEVKTTAFRLGPMARYFLPVAQKFAFFAEAGTGYTAIKVHVEKSGVNYYPGVGHPGDPTGGGQFSSSSQTRQVFLYGSLAPGIVFFPTPRLGVELKSIMLDYLSGDRAVTGLTLRNTSVGAGFYF